MKNTTAHRRGISAHAPPRTYVIMMISPFSVDLPFFVCTSTIVLMRTTEFIEPCCTYR